MERSPRRAAARLARRIDVMDDANRHLYELRGDPDHPKGPDNAFPYHDPLVIPENPFAPKISQALPSPKRTAM